MTDLERLPRYAETLAEHAGAVCAPGTVVDVHGVAPGTYPEGVTPIEAIVYPWVDRMISVQIVQNALTAEGEGYDAVAISCFFDPGLREARSLVAIPVVSLCETSLLVASAMGGRYGLIGLGPEQVYVLEELVTRYGATGRVAATLPMSPPVTEDDLESLHAGGGGLVERVEAVARRAVDMGADLIIPAEGVLNTALMRRGVTSLAGVPVLDAYGTLLCYAEMLVNLQRTSGFTVSHRGYYSGPNASGVRHFTKVTRDALDE
ncbi:MAG: aspartate/glutamate racemase family protein [Acidimicrobiales bacterium]